MFLRFRPPRIDEIEHELSRVARGSSANHPRDESLRVAIQRHPCPHAPSISGAFVAVGTFFFLGMAERPNPIILHLGDVNGADLLIVEDTAGFPPHPLNALNDTEQSIPTHSIACRSGLHSVFDESLQDEQRLIQPSA